MKHTCETCRARYEIPDARARGKVLRVRCKACAGVMRVVGLPGRPGWWVALDGQPAGPFAEHEVLALVDLGSVDARTRMWTAGMASWERVLESPRLAWVHARLVDLGCDDGLVCDGAGWFPDPTMKSGFVVLDEATQVHLAALARKNGLATEPAPAPLFLPAMAAALGFVAAVTGFVWMLALPTT